jgi:hypothetical protein
MGAPHNRRLHQSRSRRAQSQEQLRASVRDRALARSRALKRLLVAGSAALSGLFAAFAAAAFPGRTIKHTAAGAAATESSNSQAQSGGSEPTPLQPPPEAPAGGQSEGAGGQSEGAGGQSEGAGGQPSEGGEAAPPPAGNSETPSTSTGSAEAPAARATTPSESASNEPVISGGS